jgi:hypothetical protein
MQNHHSVEDSLGFRPGGFFRHLDDVSDEAVEVRSFGHARA